MGNEAHVRIDEGIPRSKRGPRRPIRNGQLTKPSHPADTGTWQIPQDLDPDAVIQRYLSEATTSQIASQYGISRKALTKWMRNQRPAEWRQAQILRALCIKEDSENGLMSAADALSLARARELLRSAQFDLQALDEDYRPKQDIRVEHTDDLGAKLRRARERVIEHESAAPQQSEPVALPAQVSCADKTG